MDENTNSSLSLEEIQSELRALQAQREALEIEMIKRLEEKRIEEVQKKFDV